VGHVASIREMQDVEFIWESWREETTWEMGE